MVLIAQHIASLRPTSRYITACCSFQDRGLSLVKPLKSSQNKPPNMRDIAAAAGVSLSTVSLVVNGKPGVSPNRRDRVLQAINEHGYSAENRQKPVATNRCSSP